MIRYMQGQKGSVVVIAIGTMLILGLFIAGLLPYLSSITRESMISQGKLQAQYAAEAGAKRAIASFGKFAAAGETPGIASDWNWIGVNTNVLGVGNATGGAYTVTLNNGNNTTYVYIPTATSDPGTYMIKSVGTFKEGTYPTASETIYVKLTVNVGGDLNYSSISWNKSPIK